MNLSALSIRRPVTMTMVLVSLMVLGIVSIVKIKLGYLPELDWPQMTVAVPYPNSSPDVTEREIARPLEEELSTLKGLKRVSSTSRPDGVDVNLELTFPQALDPIVPLGIGIGGREAPIHIARVNDDKGLWHRLAGLVSHRAGDRLPALVIDVPRRGDET